MKRLAKSVVAGVLGYQVRKLYKKNDFKVIGVAGSIGKTSTKFAIAQTLQESLRVRYQEGNYNDLVTVPLIFFNEELPSLFNPLAWLAVFWRNQKKLRKVYPYDAVVIELGSDGPGQIKEFKKYIRLDVGVVTAITPEHMQSFGTLDEVAKEEFAINEYSSLILVNKDMCENKYLKELSNVRTYALNQKSDYGKTEISKAAEGKSIAEKYSLLAATSVANELGLSQTETQRGLRNFSPVAGRMQILKGLNGATIIDDSYNSSPAAAKLALDYLYEMDAPQKIAVLGNMNELGNYAKEAHEEVGRYCNPKELSLVVTIGPEANKYLAEAADARGCKVHTFDNPYTAGEYLRSILKEETAILIKGSQNKVYSEEAVKILLANPGDSKKLVRQSNGWLKIKHKSFNL